METVSTESLSAEMSNEASRLDFSNSELSDQQIVAAVLGGEQQEFRQLVLRYQSQVFGMIMRQVNDREVAEELAQDTFLRAYRALRQFRNDSKFSTWLIRIALNVSSSYFSSRAFKERQKTVAMEVQDAKENADSDMNQNEQQNYTSYSEDQIERLRLAIQQLNPTLQSVLTLCGLEKKSYEQAAQILEIPVGTVRSRLNRARERLQQLYFEVSR